MEILSGLLFINDTDAYTRYGVFLSEEKAGDNKNYAALMKYAKAKGCTSVNFPEKPGRKYPAKITTVLDQRSVELRFTLEANNRADFFSKYGSFISMLCKGINGWNYFRLTELDRTYKFRYEECTGWDQLTDFSGKVYASFKVKFNEPEPVY